MHLDSNEIIDVQLVWVRRGKILCVKAKTLTYSCMKILLNKTSFIFCIFEKKMLICNSADIQLTVDCGDLKIKKQNKNKQHKIQFQNFTFFGEKHYNYQQGLFLAVTEQTEALSFNHLHNFYNLALLISLKFRKKQTSFPATAKENAQKFPCRWPIRAGWKWWGTDKGRTGGGPREEEAKLCLCGKLIRGCIRRT